MILRPVSNLFTGLSGTLALVGIALLPAIPGLGARARPSAGSWRTPAGTITQRAGGEIPVTGRARPGLEGLDRTMLRLMEKWHLPGGSLAVMKDGRLALARGYGYAEVESRTPARPDTLFRIASISKTLTATAILRLVQDGRLSLADKAFTLLPDLRPPAGANPDPRLQDITVRELLQHTGGWDSTKSGDPQFESLEIAGKLEIPPPAGARDMIRFWIGRPLDFAPGAQAVYSNFGFNVLGRLVEARTGQGYEAFVKSAILQPAGIRRMQIGGTFRKDRLPGEAVYYSPPGAAKVESAFTAGEMVSQAYGGWNQPALDAHGGWVASTVDLMRFLGALEGLRGRPALLAKTTMAEVERDPKPLLYRKPVSQYGLGWYIHPANGGRPNWAHTGALQGSTASLLWRGADGVSYAVVFNSLPEDLAAFFNEMETGLRDAVAAVKRWPGGDLFEEYQS
jgi:CubicO group peptidase (beta-lactamase class C family)